MNNLLAIYLIIGLLLAALSLFSGDTLEMLAQKSLFWRVLWVVLITTLWFPITVIATIIVVVGKKLNEESEE